MDYSICEWSYFLSFQSIKQKSINIDVSLYMSICETAQLANIPEELQSSEDSLYHHVGPNRRLPVSSPEGWKVSRLPLKTVFSLRTSRTAVLCQYLLKRGFLDFIVMFFVVSVSSCFIFTFFCATFWRSFLSLAFSLNNFVDVKMLEFKMWLEDFIVLPLVQHASEKQLKMIKYSSWLTISKVQAHSLLCFMAFKTILR